MGGVCTTSPDVVEARKVRALKIVGGEKNDKVTHKPHNSVNNENLNKSKLLLNVNNFDQYKQVSDLTPGRDYETRNTFEFIKGECIGSGALSSVYSGLSINTGEIVAIKSVKLICEDVEEQVNRINEAVYKLSQLQHKNIIKFISTQPSEKPGEMDIVLEYCNGGSIKQLLEKFDAFDEKLIKLYVKQILEGLLYLHERGIVHRNIKNCNILVDGNGTIKLSDFVVSNILVGDDSEAILYYNTNNGNGMLYLYLECPYWMAPEVAANETVLTPAVDIWSLGCIIIEMATRNPPWSNIAKTTDEVISLILNSTGK
jgi:serine/threonine protein kinase